MMKAIGYTHSLGINEPNALVDIDIEKPSASGRDLLVKNKCDSSQPGRL